MKRPAVFFDRDNTLIVNDGYLGNPAAVVLVEGAAEAIAHARGLGYATVVFSNQSGVARGLFGEDAVHAVNARMDELLLDQHQHAVIDRHEFCPFHPEAAVEAYRKESDLRKPQPGMIFQAAEKLALDLSRSWVIGDAARDIEAGHAAGCRTILFKDPKLPVSPAALTKAAVEADFVVSSLPEAIAIIESAGRVDRVDPEANAEPEPLPPPIAATVAVSQPKSSAPLTPRVTMTTPDKPEGDEPLGDLSKLENLAQQILHELRRNHEQPHIEFSVSKLLSGITQIMALAALFLAYLKRDTASELFPTLLLSQVLQTLTVTLLVMGRGR